MSITAIIYPLLVYSSREVTEQDFETVFSNTSNHRTYDVKPSLLQLEIKQSQEYPGEFFVLLKISILHFEYFVHEIQKEKYKLFFPAGARCQPSVCWHDAPYLGEDM
jgi:hypothetical protein